MKTKTLAAIVLAAAAVLIGSGVGFADRGQPYSGAPYTPPRGGGHYAPPRGGDHYAPPRGGNHYAPPRGGKHYAPPVGGNRYDGGRHYYHQPRPDHYRGPVQHPRHYGWPAYRPHHYYHYYDNRWDSRYYFGGSFYEPGFGFFFGSGGWW